MPNNVNDVAFFKSPAYDYGADLSEVQRRQELAKILQAQSLSPGGGTQMAGNIAIKNSNLEPLAKGAQALVGALAAKSAQDKQKEISQRSQADMQNTLAKAMQTYKGTPGSAEIPVPSDELGGGPGRDAIPAVAGDPMQAGTMLMQNPQTAQMGMSMMMDAMKSQKLAQALAGAGYGGAAGGSPPLTGAVAPASIGQAGAAPAAGAQQRGGVPPGVDPVAWALMVANGDSAGIASVLQKVQSERDKPIVGREGAPVLERGPDGKLKPSFYIPRLDPGIMPNFGPGGATSAIPVPGYNEARAATVTAEERAKQGAQAQFDLVEVPNGSGGTIRMPRAQALAMLGGGQQQPPAQPQMPPQAPMGAPQGAGQPMPPTMPMQAPINASDSTAEPLRATAPNEAAALAMAQRANAAGQPFAITAPGGGGGAAPGAGTARVGNTEMPLMGGGPPGVPQLAPSQPRGRFGETLSPAAQKAETDRLAAEVKRAENVPEGRLAAQTQLGNLDRITNQINQVINSPALARSVGLIGAFPNIPGSGAADTTAIIDSVKAQVSGMVLQAMRDASKTGGAVGAVTEKEWPRLEGMVSALDKKMSPAQFREKLGELMQEIQISKRNIQQAFDSEYGAVNGPVDRSQQQNVRQREAPTGRSIDKSDVRRQADRILGL